MVWGAGHLELCLYLGLSIGYFFKLNLYVFSWPRNYQIFFSKQCYYVKNTDNKSAKAKSAGQPIISMLNNIFWRSKRFLQAKL